MILVDDIAFTPKREISHSSFSSLHENPISSLFSLSSVSSSSIFGLQSTIPCTSVAIVAMSEDVSNNESADGLGSSGSGGGSDLVTTVTLNITPADITFNFTNTHMAPHYYRNNRF